MRVLMISPSFPPARCGVANYTGQLCDNLSRKNIEVVTVTTELPRIEGETSLHEDVKVFRVITSWNLEGVLTICRLIKEVHSDLIHIQYHGDDYQRKLMINLLPLLLQVEEIQLPVVTTLHNLQPPVLFPELGMMNLIMCSKRLILTDGTDRQELLEKYSLAESKVSVIPVGALDLYSGEVVYDRMTVRRRLGIAENETLLSFFGFVNKSKGLEVLLESLRTLVNKKLPVKLLLIAALHEDTNPQIGEYYRQIRAKIEELGLADYVTYTGFCNKDETSACLLSSAAVVLPFTEGISSKRTTFFSALSHGVPVITTGGRLLPRGVKDHHNVLLVPPGDSEKLGEAVEELMSSPDLRERIGREGKRLVEEEYSWTRVTDDTIDVYKYALSGRERVKIKEIRPPG